MVTLDRIGRVVIATLSRPPVNALNDELVARLHAVLDEVARDPDVAVLQVRSDQRVFCAGADLAAVKACFATPDGPDAMVEVVRGMQRLYERFESAPFVTLAEIDGAALGGGLELALACDLRVAAAETTLGLVESRLGLIAAGGGTQRLTRLVGPGIAKRLILAGETVDGVEAERLGLVQWVRPRAELAAWTRELSARLAEMPPAALAANKRCIAAALDIRRDGYAEELAETRKLYDHHETRQKVATFLARRAARANIQESS